MTLAAIGLSIFMTWLDANFQADWMRDFQWLTATRTDGARSLLNVIAGSTIGVAGVTFSITIVAVSFASANFGPRLIANFMRDRGNQVTLGTFIGTYVYCLMVLRTVRNASAPDIENSFQAFVPHFSVLMAIALALCSVGVLIYFIHHVPESLNVGNIASKIAKRLEDGIGNLFPDEDLSLDPEDGDLLWEARDQRSVHQQVTAKQSGYIQTLNLNQLVSLADSSNLLIRVQYRPGDFVSDIDIVIDLWAEQALSENTITDIQECFAIGNERTAHQNVLFLVDQLVEIIGRAMSPGINDPFTAINCLSWLRVGLQAFMALDRKEHMPTPSDRVWVYPITFERMSSVVFDQVQPYICADRNVVLHTVTILTLLMSHAENDRHKAILLEHLNRLSKAAEHAIPADAGGADVQKRVQEARKMVETDGAYDTHRKSQDWYAGRS